MTENAKNKPDSYWRERLTPEQYRVVREQGTEQPFSGKYVDNHEDGSYSCVACGQLLFESSTKFESGSGWPSFTNPANREHIELTKDDSFGMSRDEVRCNNCGAHLGHVFNDGPIEDGGMRYCINSLSLDFKKKETS